MRWASGSRVALGFVLETAGKPGRLGAEARAEATRYFQRAVQLERQFFDHVYA